jgi:hypothetical protein
VTDAATGQGIAGATVEARLAGPHGWDYSATTASDGSYAILGLPTGDYVVRVIAPGYAREYYDNVTPSSEAEIIHVIALHEISDIDFDLTEGGSISGHVYQSDGEPIGGALVAIKPSKYFVDDGFDVTTDSSGSYVINGLGLGEYKVWAAAPGYVEECYDGVYSWRQATNVRVIPPDTTVDVNIYLDQACAISGFVHASDGVTPIRVWVHAQGTDGTPHSESGESNPDGSYIITGLLPGTYTVRTGESLPDWYVGEYYDSKYVRRDADKVTVAAGDITDSINFTLDEGGSIAGHIYDEETGKPLFEFQVAAFSLADSDYVPQVPWPSQDGSYRFTLKEGDYLIQADVGAAAPAGYVPEWYDNAYNMEDATPVHVTSYHETSGIDFYLSKAGSISGHVYEEDGITPIAGANVYAFPITGDYPGDGANTGPDGSYTIEGLPSGNYKVQATVSDHVAEYYNNALDEASATEVTVNAPNDTPGIDFALSPVSE